jgi:hypothetical protein
MPIVNVDSVDVISNLLEAEQKNAFHFLAEADPYINRAAADIRRLLREMMQNTIRREGELASLIGELGSTPRPISVSPEHQYLAFLAADFLLPKLREAKEGSVSQYETAQRLIGNGNPLVADLLQVHLEEHRSELELLDHAMSHSAADTPAPATVARH